ncbi:hypothetical protein PAXRUDRAFT_12595 [Paxillus rubicundulus Ve08.2h10]|uniref:Uncharacterized protein n=1 Tax=Paxillus rubicundulus Ve08.2h10 TaxID=930991 RepID=A0A0D0DNT3_9AGAM|nr:hypothetical protein PAXRUDRAFT_12595 [Paxillus rubicundulus Ve08.2h10]
MAPASAQTCRGPPNLAYSNTHFGVTSLLLAYRRSPAPSIPLSPPPDERNTNSPGVVLLVWLSAISRESYARSHGHVAILLIGNKIIVSFGSSAFCLDCPL